LVAATAGGRRNRCKTLMEDEFDDVAFTELFVGDGVARNGDLLGAVAGELNFKTTRIIDSHDREALAVITEVFYTPQTSDDRNTVGFEPVEQTRIVLADGVLAGRLETNTDTDLGCSIGSSLSGGTVFTSFFSAFPHGEDLLDVLDVGVTMRKDLDTDVVFITSAVLHAGSHLFNTFTKGEVVAGFAAVD